MPRQYSPQFRERVLSLLEEGREVVPLANELGISSATIYRWRHQSLVDAGLVAGTTGVDAAANFDAKQVATESTASSSTTSQLS